MTAMRRRRIISVDYFAIASVSAIFLIPLIVWSLPDRQLQHLARIAGFAAAFADVFGIIVLIVYARETYLLRKTAEKQLATAEKPMIVFGLTSADYQLGTPMKLLEPTIRNIGSGPAFNVVIEPMKGSGVEVQFRLPNVPYIDTKQTLPLRPFITQDGQANGLSGWLSLLEDLISTGRVPADSIIGVKFDSSSGMKYQSRNRIRYDPRMKLVSTTLIPPIQERALNGS
jgi:hypothetical protein